MNDRNDCFADILQLAVSDTPARELEEMDGDDEEQDDNFDSLVQMFPEIDAAVLEE